MSSANDTRDQQLLSIGQQCSAPSCLLVDFLPFKCHHCAHAFCAEHFRPEQHQCDKFDASKHNRVAPSCPLCNTPVAVPPGEDPNIRMERHISTQCSVMTGKLGKTSTQPKCARPKCGKVLFSPIQCNNCRQQFCPQHRFPADHACGKITATGPKSVNPAINVAAQTSVASAAAMAAIKRAAASVNTTSSSKQPRAVATAARPAQPGAPVKAAASVPNPFSKTDRFPFLASSITAAALTLPPSPNDPPQRCSPEPPTSNRKSSAPLPLSAPA